MTILTINRFAGGANGTFGSMNVAGRTIYTLELPWLDNEVDKSCIPVGTYDVVKWLSPTKGWVFRLANTEPREDILIHVGNTIADSDGCILVGAAIGYVNGQPGVITSQDTLEWLLNELPTNFSLTIVQSY